MQVHTWMLTIKIGYRSSLTLGGRSSSIKPHRGPAYTNVLDLQMLPAMSKRHSEILSLYSNVEANADKIWKVAQQVWLSCTSSMISRAFVHAYRIMDIIVTHDGSNLWLAEGTPHCNIRRDFVDTKYGIKPRAASVEL